MPEYLFLGGTGREEIPLPGGNRNNKFPGCKGNKVYFDIRNKEVQPSVIWFMYLNAWERKGS